MSKFSKSLRIPTNAALCLIGWEDSESSSFFTSFLQLLDVKMRLGEMANIILQALKICGCWSTNLLKQHACSISFNEWSDGLCSCEATASLAHLVFLPPSTPQNLDLSHQTTCLLEGDLCSFLPNERKSKSVLSSSKRAMLLPGIASGAPSLLEGVSATAVKQVAEPVQKPMNSFVH